MSRKFFRNVLVIELDNEDSREMKKYVRFDNKQEKLATLTFFNLRGGGKVIASYFSVRKYVPLCKIQTRMGTNTTPSSTPNP